MRRLYPKSKVETTGFMARYYDTLLDIATFGKYLPFIKQVISIANIKPDDRILDMGAGTGRNACLIIRYLSGEGELVGVDISNDMIARFDICYAYDLLSLKEDVQIFPTLKLSIEELTKPYLIKMISAKFLSHLFCMGSHKMPGR